MSAVDAAIRAYLAAHRASAEALLAALVRVPSDNPPGDCAPHAAAAASLLEALGLTVTRLPVPDALVRDNGMISCVNLLVRMPFGTGRGPTVALKSGLTTSSAPLASRSGT